MEMFNLTRLSRTAPRKSLDSRSETERLDKTREVIVGFYEKLASEMNYHKKCRNYLSIDESRALQHYYRGLDLRSLRHIAHRKTRFLSYVVSRITECRVSPYVLDAGCGLGTEAILFALLGARVAAIDISAERINIARKRLAWYENEYGRNLHVEFSLRDLLTFNDVEKFDLIWSQQAISHIHPVERFFELAWENLKQDGRLIVCESNLMNPCVFWHVWLVHHRAGLLTEVTDPNTLQPIPYAQERTFYPRQLSGILLKAEFRTERFEYHDFLPTRLDSVGFLGRLNSFMSRIPLARMLGGSYVLEAMKTTVG